MEKASGALMTPGCVGVASGAADTVLLEMQLAYLSAARAARDSDRQRRSFPASSAREDQN